MRGKPISGNPEQDGPLLLDEIDPTRKKWKLGKTKVRQHYNFCFEIFMKLLTSAVLFNLKYSHSKCFDQVFSASILSVLFLIA
jgi:hypothetical protein